MDYCTTSRDHLHADGLAEQVVQTTKRGLRKYGLLRGSHRDWDLMLHWISMGNQFRKHASLASYNPYQLVCEREPIFPSSICKKLAHVVNLDDPNIWKECLQEQAQFFQRAMPMAMKNLFIAQHCDTLRYACCQPQTTTFKHPSLGGSPWLACLCPPFGQRLHLKTQQYKNLNTHFFIPNLMIQILMSTFSLGKSSQLPPPILHLQLLQSF